MAHYSSRNKHVHLITEASARGFLARMEAKDGGLDATTMFGVALGVSFGLGGLSGTASGAGGVSGAEEVPYRLVPAIVSEPSRCDDETRVLFSTGTRFE